MTKTTFTTFAAAFVPAILMIAASGCSSLPTLPSWSRGTSSPTRIVAIWDPVIRHEEDKVIRGFAARVMFYDGSAGKKAMRVRGNFDVYAFDEDDPKADRVTPTRVIRFQVDNLKNLESDSKLFGKSYTIWVPWDEANQDSKKKNISLVVRFTCDDGTMVMSHLAKTSLPGMTNGEQDVADTAYVNPFLDEKKQQMARLEALAAEHRNNPNLLETAWNKTVPEHVISREVRPEMMLTRSFNVPGISRDGVAPEIQPNLRFASATDEQRYQAGLLIANAQTVRAQQGNAVINPPVVQNPNLPVNHFPIGQVQFQSSDDNAPAYQQPMFQPPAQQMNQPSPSLAPMSQEAMYREYLNWQQQQATQQPVGNYAAVNTGTTWR